MHRGPMHPQEADDSGLFIPVPAHGVRVLVNNEPVSDPAFRQALLERMARQ